MAPWPSPNRFEHGSTTLWFSPEVRYVRYNKIDSDLDDNAWYKGMERAAALTQNFLHQTPSITLKIFSRSLSSDSNRGCSLSVSFPTSSTRRKAQFEPSLDGTRILIKEIMIEESLVMSQESGHTAVSQDAYSIGISSDGTTLIGILFPEGGLTALETLAQLFYAHSGSEKDAYTLYAPLVVKDAPAFEHGGLNLDVSRNWIPPQDVLRTIEAMGFNKLNKLHLYATDTQSWPLEILALPELAKQGAYQEDQIRTTKDLEEVQRHGLYHGLEVYLEIDLPGHTASIFHSHSDLVRAHNKPWATYAMELPSGRLKIDSPNVPPFLTTLFNDLLPRSSPFSPHFHIGGDEINKHTTWIPQSDPPPKKSSSLFFKSS